MAGFPNNWICIDYNKYIGLKSNINNLPVSNVETGTKVLCVDTSEVYVFVKLTSTWYLQPNKTSPVASGETYSITLDPSGGVVNSLSPVVITKGYSVSLALADISKTGYMITGWAFTSNASAFNIAIGTSYTPTADVTLYAFWAPAYKITFNTNGGDFVVATAQYRFVAIGSSSYISISVNKTGYILSGWAPTSDATVATVPSNSSYTPTADITLYAVWSPAYAITFNGNGGTSSGNDIVITNVKEGSSLTLSRTFIRTGYVFLGYALTSSETTATLPYSSSYTPTSDITIYAVWQAA